MECRDPSTARNRAVHVERSASSSASAATPLSEPLLVKLHMSRETHARAHTHCCVLRARDPRRLGGW
eukprot:2700843-Amphidinium_carterae.1